MKALVIHLLDLENNPGGPEVGCARRGTGSGGNLSGPILRLHDGISTPYSSSWRSMKLQRASTRIITRGGHCSTRLLRNVAYEERLVCTAGNGGSGCNDRLPSDTWKHSTAAASIPAAIWHLLFSHLRGSVTISSLCTECAR